MKGGLRIQLLLLLGALLLVSYVPLFFAVATYSRVALEQLQRDNSIKLAESATGYIKTLRAAHDTPEMLNVARQQIASGFVQGVSLVDRFGSVEVALGEPELIAPLRAHSQAVTEAKVSTVHTALGPAVLMLTPDPHGTIGVLLRIDSEITGSGVLVQLMALYMALAALTLVAVAYFAMTRWMVRPILQLSHAADRVIEGSRRLVVPLQAPAEIAHLAARLSEMTARLRQEEDDLRAQMQQVERKTEELRAAQNSLVRSERLATVGRLAAGLAHEVGNPISALMGLLDLVQSGDLSPAEEQDFLQRMKRETARIDRVISDLLAYARKPAHPASPSAAMVVGPPGSVQVALSAVMDLLRPQKAFQNLVVETQLAPGADYVALSHEQLMQVLLNLLMNAADACTDHGRIDITSEHDSDELLLRVSDNGPGIAAEVADSLFEPFVSTKDVGKGTGLGLSVTKGLVEAAGGSIQVQPSASGGACFEIRLPLGH